MNNDYHFIINVKREATGHLQPHNQSTGSWTGFYITARKGLQVLSDTVGYFPTINATATEMATDAGILKRSKSIMNDLKVKSVALVFDQAI